jgi:hypothetical protein
MPVIFFIILEQIKMEKKFVSKLIDKFLLVVTALLTAPLLMVGWWELDSFLSKKGLEIWEDFIINCIVYATGMIYLFVTEKTFKPFQYPQKILFFVGSMVISLIPVLAAFLLFYYKIVPLPNYLLPYAIGVCFMAGVSFGLCNYCLSLLQKKDHGKKEDDIGTVV